MTQPPDAPTPADPALPASTHAKRWTLFSQEGTDRGGAVLGDRFEVGELLGAGGTAWVYACRDQALRSMAAIKILKASGEDARRRFIEEGRILANLRHPHLVQVLAVGETIAKAPFMVLELLDGQSLDERLRKEGPLPWREVVELVAQAAGALAALHHVDVIHRDVKPGNIVQIGSATSRPLVKLIDLGIAKVLDWQRVQSGGFEPVERHQTEAGLVVGTPGSTRRRPWNRIRPVTRVNPELLLGERFEAPARPPGTARRSARAHGRWPPERPTAASRGGHWLK